MNWTGGSLGRSRNANNSVTAIQKRHFARARAKQDVQRTSPYRIAFDFVDVTRGATLGDRHSSAAREQEPAPTSSQTRLDEFRNTRPLVKKLETIRPRDATSPHEPTSSRHDEGSGSKTGRIKRKRSPITISSRSSSSVQSESGEERPPTARTSLKQGGSAEYDSLEAQRRRLLETTDWIGIKRKRPATIKFTAEEDRDLIGKRRRLSQLPRYGNTRPPKPRPRRGSHFEKLIRSPRPSQDYLSQADVSVRIGSAVDRSTRDGRQRLASSRTRSSIGDRSESLLDDLPVQLADGSQHALTVNQQKEGESSKLPSHKPFRRRSTSPIQNQVQYSSDPSFRYRRDECSEEAAGEERDCPEDLASKAMRLKEELEQIQPAESSRFRLVFDRTPQSRSESRRDTFRSPFNQNPVLPTSGHGVGKERVNQTVATPAQARHFPFVDQKPSVMIDRRAKPIEPRRLEEASTSPLSNLPSDELATLRSEVFEPRVAVTEKLRSNGAKSGKQQPIARRRSNRLRGAPIAVTAKATSQQGPADLAIETDGSQVAKVQNEPDIESTQGRKEEETVWRRFVGIDNDGVPDSMVTAFSPDLPAREASPKVQDITLNSTPGQSIARPPTRNNDIVQTKDAKKASSANYHAQDPPVEKPIEASKVEEPHPSPHEDEEAIWRTFVFGSADAIDNEWTLEEPESTNPSQQQQQKHQRAETPSRAEAACTAPSMIAEAATSPIKQNPHLMSSDLASPLNPALSSSQGNEISSLLAEAGYDDSTAALTTNEAWMEDEYDKGDQDMLDDSPLTHLSSSSDPLSSSSPHLNITSPPNPSSPPLPSSSLKAQPPSSPPPPFPTTTTTTTPFPTSTSPLPPLPSSTSPPPLTTHAPSSPSASLKQPSILFKKPARYVNVDERSSDAVEPPVVLGGGLGRRKGGGKGEGGFIGVVEGEDTSGLGWEVEDEIVDD